MFQIRVLTPRYLLTGEAEESNAFLGWMNNKNKQTLDLFGVEAIALDPNTSIPAVAAEQVTLVKQQVVAIELVSAAAQGSVKTQGRSVLSVLYTPRFIIQAQMYPPGDMDIGKIPDVTQANFVAVSDAKLHPLLPTRKLPSLEAAVMLLNWQHLDFYHER